ATHARVVEHDVEPSELLNGEVDHRFDVGLNGDVGADGSNVLLVIPREVKRVHRGLFVELSEDDGCSFIEKAQHGGSPHTAAATRDHSDLALEPAGHGSP